MPIPPLISSGWLPAPARTIPVPVIASIRFRGLEKYIPSLTWTPKSSIDQLDFTLDPTEWLAGTEDYLLSPIAKVMPSSASVDIVVLWSSLINGMAVIFLGGGQPEQTYSIQVTLTTRQGRSQVVLVEISITQNSQVSVPETAAILPNGTGIPPNAIQLSDGSILTMESGALLLIA